MAKKPETREELLAKIEALDTQSDIGQLKAEVERLTAELATVVAQRDALQREVRNYEKDFATIREAVRMSEGKRLRVHGRRPEAAGFASRMGLAEVQVGIAKGTHDPATGLPFTDETRPARDMSAGAPKVTDGELANFFPALSGP